MITSCQHEEGMSVAEIKQKVRTSEQQIRWGWPSQCEAKHHLAKNQGYLVNARNNENTDRKFCKMWIVSQNPGWKKQGKTFTVSLSVPLHPKISMLILCTVFYTFPRVLTRKICLTIKSFFIWGLFLYSHDLNVWFMGWYCKEKLDAGHPFGLNLNC